MTSTSSRSKRKGGTSRSGATRRTSTKRSGGTRGRRFGSNGGLLLWGFLALLVVLFAAIAFVSRSSGPEITTAEASGSALPTFEPGEDPAVGQPAPTLSGQALDGSELTIEPGDGTPKAIVFLAHWCPHCQREVPVVQQWIDGGGVPEGVEVVSVATGIDRNRPNFPPQDWLEREDWTVPTLVDGGDTAGRQYGLSTYPYVVMVDGDGNVVQRWSGETTADQWSARVGKLTGDTG